MQRRITLQNKAGSVFWQKCSSFIHCNQTLTFFASREGKMTVASAIGLPIRPASTEFDPKQVTPNHRMSKSKAPKANPEPDPKPAPRSNKASKPDTEVILQHWREVGFDDRLAHLIKDTSRAVVRALQVRLITHNISFGHWAFLRILWEKDGITQRALSEEAGVMESTTYTAIMAMEKLGYITREQLADNRRNNYIFLTRLGKSLKKKLVPLAEEVNAVSVQGIAETDIEKIREVLLKMLENLAADEAASDSTERRMPSTRELGKLVSESRRKKTDKK
jgi:DNA-binding MarR family transcriptional regulator